MNGKVITIPKISYLPEVKYVHIDGVKVSGVNPLSRQTINSDDWLIERMFTMGFRPEYHLIIGSDGILGDGHRRLAVARILGLDKVPVVYSDLTSKEIMSMNGGMKPWKTRQWDETEKHGVTAPGRVQGFHRRLAKIAGPKALELCRSYGIGSSIVQVLSRVMRYIGLEKATQSEALHVLEWLLSQNQQRPVMVAMHEFINPQIILHAIAERVPLKRGAWVT